jgi:hypothetical protein
VLFDFFFFPEAVDLLVDRALDFLEVEPRADVDFFSRLRDFPVDSTLSRLTILLKLLYSPPAV